MEHLNRVLKKSLVALGANKTEKATVWVGKCIGTVIDVLNNFDSDNDVQSDSGWRSPAPSKKDLETVLKELRDDVQPFMRVPGCVHGSHNYKLCTTLINTVPRDKFMKWMRSKWTRLLAGLLRELPPLMH